jgi:hypothetical protein
MISDPYIDVVSPQAGGAPKRNHLTELRQVQAAIQTKACQDIEFAQPILTLAGTGIIYPNSITTIQGQKGVHKSRLTEMICAGFVRMDAHIDFIGFRVAPLRRFHVVYVDSERNQKDQFPHAIQRIKLTAGLSQHTHPANLEAVSLISIERADRFDAIVQYLEDVRLQHGDELLVVVLDVTTDCVENFNDPRGSLKFLDHLNTTINQHNVAFICVIHENPNNLGDGKARGHLGTELINKSTTVMSIGYERAIGGVATDLIAVKFLHTRSSKRPEPHYLRYSEEAKGLLVADAGFVKTEKQRNIEKATIPELKDWLLEHLQGTMAKTELVAQLMDYFNCSERTITDRLKDLADESIGFLTYSKPAREVYYSLTTPS